MIQIDRSQANAPLRLIMEGSADLPRLAALAAEGKLRSEDVDKEIYGCAEVKKVLWDIQHQKCCFCEREYERKWSTVEHFRPKARYWWLSYDFDNLYFACQACNSAKGDRFPLMPGVTALAPGQHPRTSSESPLLIDPGHDDPEAHLTFAWIPHRGFQIAPRDDRGSATIQAIGLDRDDLVELRKNYYRLHIAPLLQRYRDAKREGNEKAVRECMRDARRLASPKSPCALLARTALRRAGLL